MPISPYIEISIGGQEVDVSSIEELPLAISYKLEDKEDFQKKKSSEALSITFPATTQNDKVGNTFHNPSVEDLTIGQVLKGIRNASIKAGGTELLTGKAFLKHAKHTNVPTSYEYDFYGNNADWAIDLKESTLYDFLQTLTFPFTKQAIIDSWQYDGTDELLPYVFGPVRYGNMMDAALVNGKTIEDYNMYPEYMKPSISKYWIIYWAFKSLGYRVQSEFFDTEYFRRQVMPWTWGAFLSSDGTRMDVLKFLAKSTQSRFIDDDYSGQITDLYVSNDSTNGGYDNSGTYDYDAANVALNWTYLPQFGFGTIEATFHIQLQYNFVATDNSTVELRFQWFKTTGGVTTRIVTGNPGENGNGDKVFDYNAPSIGGNREDGFPEFYQTFTVDPGDTITCKFYAYIHDSGLGSAHITVEVVSFDIAYFRIPLGGTIMFNSYLGLKKFKFPDFLRGVIDEFNIAVQTDSINKVVYFEPTHAYSLTNDLAANTGTGYFNGEWILWDWKQDLSKESTLENFVESERELIFKYKDDSNDGTLKKIQDRETNKLALAKYVFPDRFKAGKKEIENRFFSPTMHYDVEQWKFTGEAPQMIIMVPENVSNTSSGEAQNVFNPKSVYYKGLTTSYKWVFDAETTHPYPEMFAVNYKAGGENDPILSYADESIGDELSPVIGKGLLRRFYMQRLAIMRNGQYYSTWFRLNNKDVANFLHREHIICRGQKWELVEINNYKPLKDESTEVLLRKWSPITNA